MSFFKKTKSVETTETITKGYYSNSRIFLDLPIKEQNLSLISGAYDTEILEDNSSLVIINVQKYSGQTIEYTTFK